MSTFKITWGAGLKSEVEVADALDADAYALQRWGMDSAALVEEAYGVSLEEVSKAEQLLEQPSEGETPAA